jgi:AAA domain
MLNQNLPKQARALQNEIREAYRVLAFTTGEQAGYAIESQIRGMEDELAGYLNSTYTKKGKKPMAVTTRKPLSTPATSAATNSPFEVVSGVKAANQWLKLFLYGDYGSGKTVLSAQAVDVDNMRDVLFINIESGIQSIRGSRAVEHHADIDFIGCTTFDTFVAIHKMLLAYCQARDDDDTERITKMAQKYGFNSKKRYKTIIIDSLSELNQISLSRAFGENQDDLLATADSDDTRRDFGRNKQAMLKTVRAFRNLPMHVIATCGREWDQDERKKLGYQPRLTGALSKEVQAFWDVVGFVQTTAKRPGEDDDGDESSIARRLWLQPVGKFDAKNRLSSQEVTHIDNPTMGQLVSLLTRTKTSK